MQTPIVIKQTNNTGQVSLQSGMVSVPISVNSTLVQSSIPNMITINKPTNQNVVATSQIGGNGQQTILPTNVQIVNMRPGTPGSQKSVATVSPRVVIGSPQVVAARPATPGITLQTLPGLQPGQQGHLLLKTENGQYQLLRVGPAPGTAAASGSHTAPAPTLRLSTVPAVSRQNILPLQLPARPQLLRKTLFQVQHPAVAGAPTSVAPASVTMPVASAPQVMAPGLSATAATATAQATSQQPSATQKSSDNTKEKCRNFLANLLDLSSKEPKSVERNVRSLIQELIDAQVQPEEFCVRLERLLNASPQPCLIGFLKKSLPLLRQGLVTKELVIEGIQPPAAHVAFPPGTTMPILLSNVHMQKSLATTKAQTTPGKQISVLQNIPVQLSKIPLKGGLIKTQGSTILTGKSSFKMPTIPSSVSAASTSKLSSKDREKKSSGAFSAPFSDIDKMAGDDDINDVAAMGGVNLAEETQRILGSTELIGTQIRSCKEEYLVSLSAMQARVKAACVRHGLEDPASDVASILSHALQEQLKNHVEKLAMVALNKKTRVQLDDRYEITSDVKSQLRFLGDVERIEQARQAETNGEENMDTSLSQSKPDDETEKDELKEKHRTETEELRREETDQSALDTVGPRKKLKLDVTHENEIDEESDSVKRVNFRDLLFLLEQDKEYSRSFILLRSYLKDLL